MHRRPKLLTEAYCQCLQHWAEKVSPPVSQEFRPLAESVRELCQAVGEFVTITKRDIMEGLEMEKLIDSHRPPPMTIFGWVLDSPTEGQEKTPTAVESPSRIGCLCCGADPPYSLPANHLIIHWELPPSQQFHSPEYWQ